MENNYMIIENKRSALTPEILNGFRKNLVSDPKNILAMNACRKTDPHDICMDRTVFDNLAHVFTHKVEPEVKPITSQKNSGRCWLYAALNVLRIPFAKQHQIEEFEFSQNYLFFWDKIERSNYTLHTIAAVLQRGEQPEGRLLEYLMRMCMDDGGQWDMLVNLIKKYGVMPKRFFPDTHCCESSPRLLNIMKLKIHEYTKEMYQMVQKKMSPEKIDEKILVCLEELHRVIAICLGIPPETFTWEYYNKSKAYCSVGPITPLRFYEEYVKPYCDVEDKVCLVSDPRPENPFGATYTVDCLGNMVGGRRVVYLNLKMEDLEKYAVESIKNNEPVWFGCDVMKRYSYKLGIQDVNLHDYNLLFGIEVNKVLNKADRLIFGDSMITHAMTLTAVSLDANGEPTKWRVENSWGDDKGEKGYFIMSNDWFKEFCFEVVVDKKFLPKDLLELTKLEPKVLPAWDPMGSLAN